MLDFVRDLVLTFCLVVLGALATGTVLVGCYFVLESAFQYLLE